MINVSNDIQVPFEKQVLDKSESAEFLGVSKSSLEAMVRRGLVRPIRYNARLIRFKVSDLIALTNNQP